MHNQYVIYFIKGNMIICYLVCHGDVFFSFYMQASFGWLVKRRAKLDANVAYMRKVMKLNTL
jgi:hypothetical protein